MRVEQGFHPEPFTESHPYLRDPALPDLLKRVLPAHIRPDVEADLRRFGVAVQTEMRDLSKLVEPPRLTQYNQWGQRIDELQTSEGWRGLKALFHREGLVGIAYERLYEEYSRVYGFAKLLIAVGDSQVVNCPMSMTDGCARVIEVIGSSALKTDVQARLISRDPSIAFTAGQWMTERPGGSDVSLTETKVAPVLAVGSSSAETTPYGPKYRLDGFKWFSSATDSEVALALARTGPESGGSRALSLFLVPLRLPLLRQPGAPRPPSTSNNIFVHRLKNKVGTTILPTAELSLEGTEAYLLGEPGQGVKLITPVLNITRVHSATQSIGCLRKCLAIATAYSSVRAINGGKQLLRDTPLHVAELAKISLVYRALVHLLFGTVRLLGKAECGKASEKEQLRLRLLTPAVKAFAAEKACSAMEECMVSLGGQGYMVENEIGRLIQDALVEKIWEGTVTVLSLDFVRATSKSKALDAFAKWANTVMSSCPLDISYTLASPLATLRTALHELTTTCATLVPPLVPRPALILFSHIATSLFLLEHASWAVQAQEQSHAMDVEIFRRWVEETGLISAVGDARTAKNASTQRTYEDVAIAFGDNPTAFRQGNKAHL